jgi:hypothetical protein
MKRLVLAIVASAIAAACSSSTPAGPGPIAAGSVSTTEQKPDGVPKNWVAHLVGDSEVPPNPSKGQGQAKFQLSPDGQTMSYRLISSNINNIVQAHIHVVTAAGDPTTVNGPISVFLFGVVPPGGGRHDGVLAEGEFTTADLINGAASNPTNVFTLAQLLAVMDAGKTYVNVHTSDGLSGPSNGPGDIPGGEIRGQISSSGH